MESMGDPRWNPLLTKENTKAWLIFDNKNILMILKTSGKTFEKIFFQLTREKLTF